MTTTTDTRLQLPPANYKVVQVNQGNRRHYEVTLDGKEPIKMPGVTGTLGVINKPLLIPWATNQGIASLCSSLIAHQTKAEKTTIKQEAAWLVDAIKKAKKKKETLVTTLADDLAAHFKWPKKSTLKLDPLTLANIIEAAINAPDVVKKDAADIGSSAHEFFDLYCQGKAPPLDKVQPAARPSVERFLRWVETSGLVIAAGETMVASIKYGYGGELDAVFAVDDASKLPDYIKPLGLTEGDLVVGDYKTSNGIYDEYAFQVAAYDQAFLETYGIKCRAGVIVRFGKDQVKDEKGNPLPLDFEAKWMADPARSFKAFRAAQDLQASMKGEHFLGEEA
jgi:hypothetical protein